MNYWEEGGRAWQGRCENQPTEGPTNQRTAHVKETKKTIKLIIFDKKSSVTKLNTWTRYIHAMFDLGENKLVKSSTILNIGYCLFIID